VSDLPMPTGVGLADANRCRTCRHEAGSRQQLPFAVAGCGERLARYTRAAQVAEPHVPGALGLHPYQPVHARGRSSGGSQFGRTRRRPARARSKLLSQRNRIPRNGPATRGCLIRPSADCPRICAADLVHPAGSPTQRSASSRGIRRRAGRAKFRPRCIGERSGGRGGSMLMSGECRAALMWAVRARPAASSMPMRQRPLHSP
jgi:hypothetical protein